MDEFPEAKPPSPFELAAVPFCTRPDSPYFDPIKPVVNLS